MKSSNMNNANSQSNSKAKNSNKKPSAKRDKEVATDCNGVRSNNGMTNSDY